MKKAPKLASILLGISFLGIAIPANTNFPKEEISLKESLEQRVDEQQNKNYSYHEVSKMVHEVYRSTPRKPGYITEGFVREMVAHESSYDPSAISEKGARGLMQIMQNTWEEFDKDRSFSEYASDPRANLDVGIRYLLWIDRNFRKNYDGWENLPQDKKREMILSAYNAGIAKFEEEGWQLENMPKETKRYVGKFSKGSNN